MEAVTGAVCAHFSSSLGAVADHLKWILNSNAVFGVTCIASLAVRTASVVARIVSVVTRVASVATHEPLWICAASIKMHGFFWYGAIDNYLPFNDTCPFGSVEPLRWCDILGCIYFSDSRATIHYMLVSHLFFQIFVLRIIINPYACMKIMLLKWK